MTVFAGVAKASVAAKAARLVSLGPAPGFEAGSWVKLGHCSCGRVCSVWSRVIHYTSFMATRERATGDTEKAKV